MDTVSISSAAQAGSFTAEPGDVYRLSDLFRGSAPSGQMIAAYRIALANRGDFTARLILNGADVNNQTTFTPDQFSDLTCQAETIGSQQGMTVAAQTGRKLPNGTLSQVMERRPLRPSGPAPWQAGSEPGVQACRNGSSAGRMLEVR